MMLKCEHCGTQAEAHVSEADHPWGGPDFTVEDLPAQFIHSKQSEYTLQNEFTCAECGRRVK